VLAWFYGDVNEVTALRLFLPIAWLLPLGWLAAFTSPRMARLQFVVIALMCGARMSFAVAGDAFPQLRIATLTHELDRLVTRLPGDRGTTLWVGAPAQHLIVKGHAAVSVKTFVQMRQDIAQLQRQGDVVQIYLIATPLDRDMEPVLGSPRELLRRVPNHVVERVGGDMPITVYEFDR
jgi:hypothetical protein